MWCDKWLRTRTLARHLRELLGPPRGAPWDAICSAPSPFKETIVAELGLVEHPTLLSSIPGWTHPKVIVVTHASPARIAWLQEAAPAVEFVLATNEATALAAISDADAVVGWCTREMVRRGRRLRWIQIDTAGSEGVLYRIPELASRSIFVSNLQRAAGPVIAEHVFAMLLALTRGIRRFSAAASGWRRAPQMPLETLSGKRMLIAGLGGIGQEVALIAQGFKMHVSGIRASERPPPPSVTEIGPLNSLEDMAINADVVVNALPLTPQTEGRFGRNAFSAMKPSAYFINVGRGRSVDTDALVAALSRGEIAGAGLDVTDPEPLPWLHPLRRMGNVLITPHIAGISATTKEREWRVCRENIRRFATGDRLLSVVSISKGY